MFFLIENLSCLHLQCLEGLQVHLGMPYQLKYPCICLFAFYSGNFIAVIKVSTCKVAIKSPYESMLFDSSNLIRPILSRCQPFWVRKVLLVYISYIKLNVGAQHLLLLLTPSCHKPPATITCAQWHQKEKTTVVTLCSSCQHMLVGFQHLLNTLFSL